jgi:hypothetical protein
LLWIWSLNTSTLKECCLVYWNSVIENMVNCYYYNKWWKNVPILNWGWLQVRSSPRLKMEHDGRLLVFYSHFLPPSKPWTQRKHVNQHAMILPGDAKAEGSTLYAPWEYICMHQQVNWKLKPERYHRIFGCQDFTVIQKTERTCNIGFRLNELWSYSYTCTQEATIFLKYEITTTLTISHYP